MKLALRTKPALNLVQGWRSRFSWHICHYLLDPFDPTGAHCDDEVPVLKG